MEILIEILKSFRVYNKKHSQKDIFELQLIPIPVFQYY